MSMSDSILKDKYPAKAHARRVAEYLQKKGYSKKGVLYLESQKTRLIEDNDEPVPFRYSQHVLEPSLAVLARFEPSLTALILFNRKTPADQSYMPDNGAPSTTSRAAHFLIAT